MDDEAFAEPPGDSPGVRNPYLEGNFAPVMVEHTVSLLDVEGSIPPSLEGLLVRNGPNPALAPDPATYHWFSGDGMVHALELRDGQAVSYQNRWVRTRKLAAAVGTRPPRGPEEPIDGPANTHVVWHAGRLLALVESGLPHTLSTDLETVRVEDFDGALASPMTAHPHVDPESGAMAFFGYDVFGPPFLRYHEMDASGMLVHSTEIEVPRATMQHDFGVTASRVVFMDLPVVFDLDMAVAGSSLPFRWDPTAGARVGVLERGTDGADISWVSIDPCYVFHVMNAYDDGDGVVLDVLRYARTFDLPGGGLLGSTLPTLERWEVDAQAGTVKTSALDDETVEFPRIDDTLAGRPYRYGYCTVVRREGGVDALTGLIRYDLARDEARRWDPGPGLAPSEPIFVRDVDGRADDEGWVLAVVYDPARDASDVVILDASAFGGKPDAVIHLPCRVPFGFHGSWVPAAAYR